VRFSIRLNNDLPLEQYSRLAQAAERAGFDQFWVSHDLFLRSVWVILASVAQATDRLRIGTCIVNPYTCHPAEIAMASATLDELSGGRLNLGISAGAADFLAWVGLDQPRPLSAVLESVEAIRRLLDGRKVSPEGRFLSGWTEQAYLRFSARRVPIYLGAMAPKMLRAIGQVADGGLPLLFPPEHYETAIGYIREGAQQAGRSLDSIDVAACVWCSISADRQAAETVLREKIAYYGHTFSPLIMEQLGLTRQDFAPIEAAMRQRDLSKARDLVTPRMLRIGIVGTPVDLIERLEGLVRLGARHLSFGPPLGPDPLEAIEILGREVLPHFRPRAV
jgi:5,10-methylenetetrahydromethanopterin reductase